MARQRRRGPDRDDPERMSFASAGTFDLPLFAGVGGRHRDEGLDAIEAHYPTWLARIRTVARNISRIRGTVSADDLRVWADRNNDQPAHPNAWGAVFRGKEWRPVGRITNGQPSAHARSVVLWRWVEGGRTP